MPSLSERDLAALAALADAAESISDDLEERRRRALAARDDEEIARIHEEYRGSPRSPTSLSAMRDSASGPSPSCWPLPRS